MWNLSRKYQILGDHPLFVLYRNNLKNKLLYKLLFVFYKNNFEIKSVLGPFCLNSHFSKQHLGVLPVRSFTIICRLKARKYHHGVSLSLVQRQVNTFYFTSNFNSLLVLVVEPHLSNSYQCTMRNNSAFKNSFDQKLLCIIFYSPMGEMFYGFVLAAHAVTFAVYPSQYSKIHNFPFFC